MILSRVTVVGNENNKPITLDDLRALVEKADEAWVPGDSWVRLLNGAIVFDLYVETNREEYR